MEVILAAQGQTLEPKPSQTQKGRKNGTTSSSMKKIWMKARKPGFTNLRDYKASLEKK